MNKKRWKILSIAPATYLVLVGLGLLYHLAHRGYPPKPVGECVALAVIGGLRFFTTVSGVVILLGLFVWFCSSPSEPSRRR